MSKQEELRKQTKSTLSKNNSTTLFNKLEKGTLLGLSFEVAIEILEKRGEDVSKYKTSQNTPIATGLNKTITKKKTGEENSDEEELGDEPTEVKVEKSKKEKTPKEPGKKPNSVRIREMDAAGATDAEIRLELGVKDSYIKAVRNFDLDKRKKDA